MEDVIDREGFGGLVWDHTRNFRCFLALVVLMSCILVAGCGGGGAEKANQEPVPKPDADAKGKAGAPGANKAGGSTVQSSTGAETLEDTPVSLNLNQPIPPDFRAAYQRKALIVVEFSKRGEDEFYPQGLEVDDLVSRYLRDLRDQYPQVEFFTYDIDRPGDAESSEDLSRGEYGTLAVQLEVGYTPFVIMLAPRGEEYIVENLFQGYTERGVLSQALFDLTSVDVRGNSSRVEVALDQIELTETGGGVEYFTVTNEGEVEANLEGFSLRVVDPESGEVNDESEGVRVNENIMVAPGESVSVGRAPDVVDADANEVAGTFAGGDSLTLRPGDQVALLDLGGAVIDTISI